jgi:hypothetical protein
MSFHHAFPTPFWSLPATILVTARVTPGVLVVSWWSTAARTSTARFKRDPCLGSRVGSHGCADRPRIDLRRSEKVARRTSGDLKLVAFDKRVAHCPSVLYPRRTTSKSASQTSTALAHDLPVLARVTPTNK